MAVNNINDEEMFYNAIQKRSEENEKAFKWLMREKLYSLVGSVLRLELDSLIRLVYLKSINDAKTKNELLRQFRQGKRWQQESRLITDRKMLDNLISSLSLDWAKPIYDICCAFIHLSPYHDWATSGPTDNLTQEQRQHIVEHVKWQQKKDLNIDFDFYGLVGIADGVFDKLKDNLRHELENTN